MLVSLAAAAPASAAHKQHTHKIHKPHRHVTHRALSAGALSGRMADATGSSGSHAKNFTLRISPDASTAVASGENVTITATLTNESSSDKLGSADVFAPFVLPPSHSFKVLTASSSAGTASVLSGCPLGRAHVPCVALRGAGLAPHASLSITMTVQTPVCEEGSDFFWLAVAKQSGNFGRGENGGLFKLDLADSQLRTALDGACKLIFSTGPADALPGAVISGTADDPTGPALTVQVVDSNGNVVSDADLPVTMSLATNPASATLSGTKTVDTSSGVATFTDLSLNLPGMGFALKASSGSLTPATSVPFDIGGNTATCDVNASCQVTDTNATGGVNVFADPGPGNGELVEAMEAPLTNGECAGYDTLDENGYVYESTVARSTVVTITIIPQAPLKFPADVELESQQLCFGATQDFVDSQGQLAPAATLPGGQAGFVGLLPDCTSESTGPCFDRAASSAPSDPSSPAGFDLVLVANVPSGFAEDPHMS
jgi:hypothetical protein